MVGGAPPSATVAARLRPGRQARHRPKGLIGERGFDYANIFTNPDLSDPEPPVAIAPGVFERRLQIVSDVAGLEWERPLRWVLAWTGMSAAWFLGNGDVAEIDFKVAEVAAAELDRATKDHP